MLNTYNNNNNNNNTNKMHTSAIVLMYNNLQNVLATHWPFQGENTKDKTLKDETIIS